MATLASLVVGGGLFAAWARYALGPGSAEALLRGETLVLEPASFSVGVLRPGEQRFLEVGVRNLGREPVAILGVEGTCCPQVCVSPKETLPIRVAPGRREVFTFDLRARSPGDVLAEPGRFALKLAVYTEVGDREVSIDGDLPTIFAGFPAQEQAE